MLMSLSPAIAGRVKRLEVKLVTVVESAERLLSEVLG